MPSAASSHFVNLKVPVRISHVATGESSKELAKPNLWILAILAKSQIAQIMKCFKIIVNLKYSLLLESRVVVLVVKRLPSDITPFFSKDAP